jgi:hypothetical protein
MARRSIGDIWISVPGEVSGYPEGQTTGIFGNKCTIGGRILQQNSSFALLKIGGYGTGIAVQLSN